MRDSGYAARALVSAPRSHFDALQELFGAVRIAWSLAAHRPAPGTAVVRVLIVEDDPFVALDLECIIQEAFNAEVCIAGSVAQARACAGEGGDGRKIDFAFLDIDMPDGKIYEVAVELQRRGVPFAFVSGEQLGCVPARLRDAPFIAKPYKIWQIAQSLRSRPSDAPRS